VFNKRFVLLIKAAERHTKRNRDVTLLFDVAISGKMWAVLFESSSISTVVYRHECCELRVERLRQQRPRERMTSIASRKEVKVACSNDGCSASRFIQHIISHKNAPGVVFSRFSLSRRSINRQFRQNPVMWILVMSALNGRRKSRRHRAGVYGNGDKRHPSARRASRGTTSRTGTGSTCRRRGGPAHHVVHLRVSGSSWWIAPGMLC
jgi:hypothetical protein